MTVETLDSGLRVAVLPDRGTECVHIVLAAAAGSFHEGRESGRGVAHWVEHLLFDGCGEFPGDGAVKKVAEIGGAFNAMTSQYRTEYTLSLRKRDLETGLRVLGAMVRQPLFTPGAVEHERAVIAREIDLCADDPEIRHDEMLYRLIYGDSPLGAPVEGRAAGFRNADGGAPERFFNRWYRPERMILILAGDTLPEEAMAQAERFFSLRAGWPLRAGSPPEPPPPVPVSPGLRRAERFPDPDTSRIAVGFPFPGGDRRGYRAGRLLAGILAGNPSSLLEKLFCREKRLARDISASLDGDGAAGIFRVEAECAPGDLRELEAALIDRLDGFDPREIPPGMLEAEKLQSRADLRWELRDPAALALKIADRMTLPGTAFDAWDPEADEKAVSELSGDDMAAFASAYLRPECRGVAILTAEPRRARPLRRHAAVRDRAEVPFRVVKTPDSSGMIDVSLLLPADALVESPEENGATALLGKVLEAGPEGTGEEAWLSGLDNSAISLESDVNCSALRLEFSAPAESELRLWQYLEEMLLRPAFPPEVVRREARILAGEWRSRETSGAAVADRARALLFGPDHPGALPPGDPSNIRRMTAGRLRDLYGRIWDPSRAVLGIGGSYTEPLAEHFAARLAAEAPWRRPISPDMARRRRIKARGPVCETVPLDREQCVAVMLMPGPELSMIEDMAALKVAEYAESGLSGRLFRSVREERDLAYSVSMTPASGFGYGVIVFEAGCEYAAAKRVTELFAAEADAAAAGAIDRRSFELARAEYMVAMAVRNSNRSDLCRMRALAEYAGTGGLEEAVKNLTFERFRTIVGKWFGNPVRVTAVSGKPEKRRAVRRWEKKFSI